METSGWYKQESNRLCFGQAAVSEQCEIFTELSTSRCGFRSQLGGYESRIEVEETEERWQKSKEVGYGYIEVKRRCFSERYRERCETKCWSNSRRKMDRIEREYINKCEEIR